MKTIQDITKNLLTDDERRKKDIELIAKQLNEANGKLSLQAMVYYAYIVGVARGENTARLYQAKQSDIASQN